MSAPRLRRHRGALAAPLVGWLLAPSLTVALAIAPATAALAAWSTQGSGSAAGGSATMPSGTEPSGSASGSSVTITWAQADLSDGTPVAGYVVTVYNDDTGAEGTVGGSCAGVVTTTSCTDSSVAPGSWVYADTPVQLGWTGAGSPLSAPIVVSSAPTNPFT